MKRITIDRTAHGDEAAEFCWWCGSCGWTATLGDEAEINGVPANRHNDSQRNDGTDPAADQYDALWEVYCDEIGETHEYHPEDEPGQWQAALQPEPYTRLRPGDRVYLPGEPSQDGNDFMRACVLADLALEWQDYGADEGDEYLLVPADQSHPAGQCYGG